jgi:exodeoxyribonuclease V gamma subunit
MALNLNASNSLDRLTEKLAEGLTSQQLHVFQPQYIVTQTEGMNNWLKLQIAGKLGIAANYRFLQPNDLIQEVFSVLGGKQNQVLSAENLTWLLFVLLGAPEFTGRFKAVSQYYNHDGFDRDLKRLALAEKTADLLDQYQVYRPEMIRLWNENEPAGIGSDEWQKYLWKKAKRLSAGRFPDRTEAGSFILSSLRDPSQLAILRKKIPAIHVFGLAIITTYHMQVLYELGKYMDISFYILNPAPAVYWFDTKSEKQLALWKQKGYKLLMNEVAGNTLLTNWGRVIQDTFSLLFQHDEFLNAYNEIGEDPPEPDSLLQKIRHDIYFNAGADERNSITPADIRDGSITINACFTIAREVEVLYNFLVHTIHTRKELLSSRDIVVMVSNVDAYAPYIKAVFDHGPYAFRYNIADESFMATDSIFNALHSLLSITEQNFYAEEVLQLLDSVYIRKRFGLYNLALLRRTVNKANIRFGFEGSREDDTVYVSWKYGIQRIMYGICMSGSGEFGVDEDSLYPLDAPEGEDALQLVRFTHFVQVLMDAVKERKSSRTAAEWVEYVERLMYNLLYEPGEEVDEDYNLLLKELEKFNVFNELLTEKIGFDVFSHSFLKTISTCTRTGTFGTGGITFCSLIPMRSIPFKIVALLGIDFDKFPRKESAPAFSLMEREKRRGDRSVKDNDKHLFLESILSAEKYLYISYLGQSPKDNTVLPPSALVDELIDYISSGCVPAVDVNQALVTRQPLHGFSRKYDRSDERLYSYLDENSRTKHLHFESSKEQKPFDFNEIRLKDFTAFFRNPVKAYYNKVLGIYYKDAAVLLDDTEMFELDKLQEWSLKQQLLVMDDDQKDALKRRLLKTGGLPLKYMSDVSLRAVEARVVPIRENFRSSVNETQETTLPVELPVDGSVLKGTLPVYGNRLLFVSFSKDEIKYMVEAYISYLVATAAGASIDLWFISSAKDKTFRGSPVSAAEAMDRLKGLLQLYKKGHAEILAFSPDFDISPGDLQNLDQDKLKSRLETKLEGFNSRKADPYLLKEYDNGFFGRAAFIEQFKANSAQVIAPLAGVFPDYFKKD